ncbi:hypothetical protein D3C86_914480 [compost metagenome]
MVSPVLAYLIVPLKERFPWFAAGFAAGSATGFFSLAGSKRINTSAPKGLNCIGCPVNASFSMVDRGLSFAITLSFILLVATCSLYVNLTPLTLVILSSAAFKGSLLSVIVMRFASGSCAHAWVCTINNSSNTMAMHVRNLTCPFSFI